MILNSFKKNEWFDNIPQNIIAGIVVAIAIIPEAIGFSIIANVNPMVGLYTSLMLTIIISIFGGRPAMISAATGAMALVMVSLVKNHGVEYLFAATILTGIIQYIFGIFKVSRVMQFIPRTVMIGFVNALAILIFLAQLPHLINTSIASYLFVGATLLILYISPKLIKKIPAPLIALVSLTIISLLLNVNLSTIGDLATLESSLPMFSVPKIPITLESLAIIFPYSLSLSVVGLLESMLTARIIDDITDTESDKNQEAKGQGIANIIAGFFGGMAGCAMIGQSMINVKSGGRSRVSTLTVGVFLLISILFFAEIIMKIPLAILVGIMIMVSIDTFDWESFSYLKKMPVTDSIVMVSTIAIVVFTHDLSKGVLAGVILSALFFVTKISKINVSCTESENKIIYAIKGELFFASVDNFINQFDFSSSENEIILDFKKAHVWDDSAVGAIDKVVLKYRNKGLNVTVENLNTQSKELVDLLCIHHQHKSIATQH